MLQQGRPGGGGANDQTTSAHVESAAGHVGKGFAISGCEMFKGFRSVPLHPKDKPTILAS